MTGLKDFRLKVLTVAIATVLTVVVIGLAGEFAVRFREEHRSTVPGSMPLLFYRHGTLGHALVREARYFGWVHTNAQGFRGLRPVSLQRKPGVTRILAVGGSTTFDSFVTSDSSAWPARLEVWLQRYCPDRAFEVINAGVPGYRVSQDLIRLETELYVYDPDLIIFYQGHNDLIRNLRPFATGPGGQAKRPNEIPSITPWRAWAEGHSLLYAKLVARFKLIRFKASPTRNPLVTVLPDYGATEFERLVVQYLAAAQALGLRVVIPELVQTSGATTTEQDLVKRQIWRATMPYVDPDTVMRAYERYNEVLAEAARRAHVTFLPMLQLDIVGPEYYSPGDPIHFNDAGADRFAEGLARGLISADLIQ